jgi:hypothetical protein
MLVTLEATVRAVKNIRKLSFGGDAGHKSAGDSC